MSDLSEIIHSYSQALENSRATFHASERFRRDKRRREDSIPLRVYRKWTNYSDLGEDDLVEHKSSLLEGIFQKYTFKIVSERVSAEISDVKTEAFLGDGRITGVTVYIPNPILKLLGTVQSSDYDTAKMYHRRVTDNVLKSGLSRQAKQYLDRCTYPYANVGWSVHGLIGDLASKMRLSPSGVAAKKSWMEEAMKSTTAGPPIDDILKVYDACIFTPSPLDTEAQHVGSTLAQVEESGRALSLDWIQEWTDVKRTELYAQIVKSLQEDTPGIDPSDVEIQADKLTKELIDKEWSEDEQHQKALDRLLGHFTEHAPPSDYASSVDLFPIVFGHNLKDHATGTMRATDPNGVKTVLTSGDERDWSLEAFLPPAFSELLSQTQG
jgi:hypothetical protein